MRLLRGLLVCVVAVGWIACSDDTTPPTEAGVDLPKADSSTDIGTDQPPPTPDGQPDQGQPEVGVDGPIVDAPVPDITPDITPDISPDTLSPDLGPPTNGACAVAQTVTLVNGKAVVNGDTSVFTDEFSTLKCPGTTSALDGKQAYYKFAGVKDQWYKIVLAPEFTAYLYTFTNSSCAVTDIQTDCTSAGATGDALNSIFGGDVETLYFKAPATADVYVGVDSTSSFSEGKFKLTISEFTVPTNIKCEAAQVLTFTSSKATVNGDTSKLWSPNLFGTSIDCGSTSSSNVQDGPQVYYQFTAAANKAYRIQLTTTEADNLRFHVFRVASCPSTGGVTASINTDCGSKGATGAVWASNLDTGKVGMVLLQPAAAGDFIIAVDSTKEDNFGGFKLDIDEFTIATNSTCATATPITLINGKASLAGDTAGTADEYGSAVDCGGSSNLDGPQVYYELTPATGKTYKVTFKPTFSAYAFWFQKASCGTGATINTDCSSAGATGNRSPFTSAGSTKVFYVGPSTAPVIIGVDSTSPGNVGAFTLDVEEVNAPANGTCATATPITLTSGKATINGTTGGTADEFGAAVDCGRFSNFDGPNAYYELTPATGKYYKVTLKPTFTAYLYWFRKASCGTATAIDADCTTSGTDGDNVGSISAGETASLSITGAPVIIAVDSTAGYNSGDFELTVEEINPPANDTCATAETVILTAGKGTVSADTSLGYTNTFPGFTCGKTNTFDSPDAYYKFAGLANKIYKVTFTPTNGGRVYAFTAASNCVQASVETECSAGAGYKFVPSGSSGSIFVKTTTATDVYFVADGISSSYQGPSKFEIEEVVAPTNTTCATPKALTLATSPVNEAGDTLLSSDEFATIDCGTSSGFPWEGHNLYYKVTLAAGTTYTFDLTATFDSALYAFPAATACAATAINSACASPLPADPNNVYNDDSISPQSGERLKITPATAGDWIIVVDSYSLSEFGTFDLKVTW